jgi:magnesium-transporting ATPase (P-type)
MKGAEMQSETAAWHAMEPEAVYRELQCSREGLGEPEAKKRLAKFGYNRMKPPKKKTLLQRFFSQFHNILIYVLLAAGGVTALLGHWVDSGVILGVVVVNAVIGVVQEGKAEKALDAIRKMLSSQAMTRRNGTFVLIPAEELVPGDIVTLQSGDKVPADLRLITVKELQVDEALLTGESLPVAKQKEAVSEGAVIAERRSIAHSGTLVTYGTATGVVVATAEATQIGRISVMLREVQTLTTPLMKQVARFAQWLTGGIVAIAAATFLFGLLVHGYTTVEMFMAAVGLAVAAIPEGLPAIMTIALAIGVQKMARRNAIIRRLPAVETLGSVSVICSDKTGTLTKNEMTVRSVSTAAADYEVSGSGYNPHGFFCREGREVDLSEHPVLTLLARSAMLCNDAAVEGAGEGWRLRGDPTEGALVVMAMKSALDHALEQERRPRTDVIPFESQHGFMATLHHDHEGHGIIFVKGSPERVLEMCSSQRVHHENAPLDASDWQRRLDAMAERGERVLAVAFREVAEEQSTVRFDDLQGTLTLLGIVGMIDPPRDEAVAAVKACQSAGIRVKMITGDHLKTAAAIGNAMGIGGDAEAISGKTLESLGDDALSARIDGVDIFARTSPEQKLRIVTALQAKGHVVAMTGDGVNDAPALKRADVGIAMGVNGTEVSKEAAEIVLADDNFASIAHAVEEGRTVYDNLKKSILFILPTNGGEALTIVAAIAMGRMLPITPVQILWVNMITAVTLALTLAFERAEGDVMRRTPRDPGDPLLSPLLLWRILSVSLVLMAGTFGLFVWYRTGGCCIEEARTVAVNVLVFFEIFYLFNTRHFYDSAFRKETLTGNRYAVYAAAVLIVFQIAFTYASPMQLLFHTTPLSAMQWAHIVTVASSLFFLVELEKWLVRRLRARRGRTVARQ